MEAVFYDLAFNNSHGNERPEPTHARINRKEQYARAHGSAEQI